MQNKKPSGSAQAKDNNLTTHRNSYKTNNGKSNGMKFAYLHPKCASADANQTGSQAKPNIM